ncbi:alanyl-tRNA editing protein [Bacillota bacterium]
MKSCEGTIISASKDDESETYLLELDRTVFFPEGGGQPSDTGYIAGSFGELEVTEVFEKDDNIYHRVNPLQKNDSNGSTSFPRNLAGEAVSCRLDWDRRFSHMQRHCGEHILSAVFDCLYGGVNRGFHMGEDYMTIDISLEKKTDFTDMTEDMIRKAEWASNKMIWDNLPVSVRYFADREEAAAQPVRKPISIDGDIILVCVGDESISSGCVACCGTHPHSTGEVGLIKIYRWESYKGMTRITFDAGPNALLSCRNDAALIKELSAQYSSDPKLLSENIKKREQKNNEIRQELYGLKQAYLSDRASEISGMLTGPARVIIKEHELLKTDDLLNLAKMLPDASGKLIALVSIRENTLILISSGTPDCNKIVKDNAGVWNGKGGGRPNSARAMFPTKDNLDCFTEYLTKAY